MTWEVSIIILGIWFLCSAAQLDLQYKRISNGLGTNAVILQSLWGVSFRQAHPTVLGHSRPLHKAMQYLYIT